MQARDRDEGRFVGSADGAHQAGRDLAVLQAALLPAGVPILPRVAVGARYLLAEVDTAAGGDWYDAVVRSDGSVGLVVGDVAGHGVAASAAMGQLRAVARHCLESGGSPAGVVTALDQSPAPSTARTPPPSASRCWTRARARSGSARRGTRRRCCSPNSGPRYLARPAGPLATGAAYAHAEDRMADGDVLLLYSDGIVERPGVHPAQGDHDLADAAAHSQRRLDSGPAAQRFCDDVLALLIRSTGYQDDVTLLAAQRHPAGEGGAVAPRHPGRGDDHPRRPRRVAGRSRGRRPDLHRHHTPSARS